VPANFIFVIIGLAAGVLAGMFGIGGGIIIVPALILFAGFAPKMANGTSLAVFLLPVGALGAYTYYKEGLVRIGPALIMGAGLFLGSYIGARINQQVAPLMLKRGFALLLIATAARMWFSK